MTTRGNHLVFYGASDDLAEASEIIPGVGEVDVDEACNDANGKPLSFRVCDPSTGEAVRVVLTYGSTGTWSVGISQDDDGVVLPAWGFSYDTSTQAGYSVRLHVVGAPGHVFTVEEVKS